MKIAICSQSNNLQAAVDSRFGRAAYFAVYDDAAKQWEFIENTQNLQAVQGAGIQAAQLILDADVNVLIAASVGPKAMTVLTAGGVAVFNAADNQTVHQAIADYQAGALERMPQANVEGHWI
jgi:predicted Fe-Mo cluster-binding NifX family protein